MAAKKPIRVWADPSDPCIVFPVEKFPKQSDCSHRDYPEHAKSMELFDLVPVAAKKRKAK